MLPRHYLSVARPSGGLVQREMSPEESQDSFVQSCIRDWDALGDIRDPGFAATAQAYIERYKEVPDASVWVAKADGVGSGEHYAARGSRVVDEFVRHGVCLDSGRGLPDGPTDTRRGSFLQRPSARGADQGGVLDEEARGDARGVGGGDGNEPVGVLELRHAVPDRECVVRRHARFHTEVELAGIREGVRIPIADRGGVGVRGAGGGHPGRATAS